MSNTNTSATGGYLSPTFDTPPLEDSALDVVFQHMIVGITELSGNMVRPRWQLLPPKQPEPYIDWCAFGVIDQEPDDNVAIIPSADGLSTLLQRHEDFELLVTFYGPNRQLFATKLRDGLALTQNREQIKLNSIDFITSAKMRSIPELVNQQWIRRVDLPLHFRREIERTYAIENIASANGTFTADNSSQGLLFRDF